MKLRDVPIEDTLTEAYYAAMMRVGEPPRPKALERLECIAKLWEGKERPPGTITVQQALQFVKRMRAATERLLRDVMNQQGGQPVGSEIPGVRTVPRLKESHRRSHRHSGLHRADQ